MGYLWSKTLSKINKMVVCKIFISISLLFLIDGCTVIGYTIGSIKDGSTPESESIPYCRWADIEDGSDIKVISINGDTSEGIYISSEPLSLSESIEKYRKWYQNYGDTLSLLNIDDTVMFKTINNFYKGLFYGFDFNNVSVKYTDNNVRGVLPVKEIVVISDRYGKTLTGEDLSNKINSRSLPVSVAITFMKDKDTLAMPVTDIKDIKIKFSRNAKWWGALIGLPADALLVAVIYFLSNLSFTD